MGVAMGGAVVVLAAAVVGSGFAGWWLAGKLTSVVALKVLGAAAGLAVGVYGPSMLIKSQS